MVSSPLKLLMKLLPQNNLSKKEGFLKFYSIIIYRALLLRVVLIIIG